MVNSVFPGVSVSTVTYSPIHELFDSRVWEYWAMLLVMGGMVVLGYGVARQEDRDRALRRQKRQLGRSRLSPPPPQLSRPRQRAVSYDVRSDRMNDPRPSDPRPGSSPRRR